MFFLDFDYLNEILINNPYLIFIFLILFFIDSFPPFAFFIPLLLINMVAYYYLINFNPELIVFYTLFTSLSILLGDLAYLKIYNGSLFTKLTKNRLEMDIKSKGLNLNKFLNYVLIRFNVLYKLIFFEKLNKSLDIKKIIFLYLGILIFLSIIFFSVVLVYLFDKLLKVKYLDILFLIAFILIFNYVFSLDLNKNEK